MADGAHLGLATLVVDLRVLGKPHPTHCSMLHDAVTHRRSISLGLKSNPALELRPCRSQ